MNQRGADNEAMRKHLENFEYRLNGIEDLERQKTS